MFLTGAVVIPPVYSLVTKYRTAEIVEKYGNFDSQTIIMIVGFVILFILLCSTWFGMFCKWTKKKRAATDSPISHEMRQMSEINSTAGDEDCHQQTGQSSSRDDPGLVQTETVLHSDGTVENVTHSSTGMVTHKRYLTSHKHLLFDPLCD